MPARPARASRSLDPYPADTTSLDGASEASQRGTPPDRNRAEWPLRHVTGDSMTTGVGFIPISAAMRA